MKTVRICLFALFIFTPFVAIHAEDTVFIRDMAGRFDRCRQNRSGSLPRAGGLRLIAYLGVQHKLVGIEGMEKNLPTGRPYWYANQALARLPVIGPGGPAAINKDPDLEAVLSVKPQLIFITQMEAARAEALQRKLSIPVVLLSYGKVGGFDRWCTIPLRPRGRSWGRRKGPKR